MAIIPGSNSGETLTGTNGDDTITALAGIDALYGLAGTDTLDGGLDGDYLYGGPGDDIMLGGAGDDHYYVDSAGDQVVEQPGEGTDFVSTSVDFTLPDDVEHMYLSGTGDINGTGNALKNTIRDNAGINILAGGAGNDSYVVQNTGDQVIELANAGTDYVNSTASFTLGANIENLVLKGTANINGTGNDRNNNLTGNTGINVLAGAAGSDHYFVQNTGDQVVEQPGEGTDFVHTSVDFTLPDNVEHMYLTGTGAINGTGNALRNTIRDNAGINILAGGAGIDSYVVQNTGDQVIEQANEGTDYVSSTATFTLGANVEHLVLKGSADIDGTGNGLDNKIDGNGGNNVLAGGGGQDRLIGSAGLDTMDGGDGNDVLVGGAGNDSMLGGAGGDDLRGEAGDDTIAGGNGTDTLDGGTGADTMRGGDGVDSYTVDDVGDQVIEAANEGNDFVYSTVNFTLGDNIEHLFLSGSASISGTGNALDNSLTGNDSANTLNGGGGNDVLDGRGGSDIMNGGSGNDRYNVNAGDQIIEATNGGTDEIHVSISFTLPDNVENAVVRSLGSSKTITGNELDNMFTTLSSTHNTRIFGGEGNDTYDLGTNGGVIFEDAGGGVDTVRAGKLANILSGNVENLILTGSGIIGTGNDLDNEITGNSSDNVLEGREGNDDIDGGNGQDTAQFSGNLEDYAITENLATGVVTVTDNVGNDGTDTLSHIERLHFADTAVPAHGIRSGTSASETLVGTENGDVMLGRGGDDTLRGLGGSDNLEGGSGDDILDGGADGDHMTGGSGNDTYTVDNLDGVHEQANGGTDTVIASVNFTLPDNVENLTLTGTHGGINGTGNALDNRITGGGFDNTLAGGGGQDIFVFNTAIDGANNSDMITDFSVDDEIHLDSRIFTALTPGAYLDPDVFFIGDPFAADGALIVYFLGGEIDHSNVYYDADGIPGGSFVPMRFPLGVVLTAHDFFVI